MPQVSVVERDYPNLAERFTALGPLMDRLGNGGKGIAWETGHEVKALSVYGKHESLEGAPIEGSVIVEFPSIEAAKAWYDGPAYAAAREHRFKGADYRVFITEGL